MPDKVAVEASRFYPFVLASQPRGEIVNQKEGLSYTRYIIYQCQTGGDIRLT